MSRDMHRHATGCQQRLAKRVIDGTEGDALYPAAILSADETTDVIPAHNVCFQNARRRKNETRPRVAGAKGRQMLQRFDEFDAGAARLQTAIDTKLRDDAFAAHIFRNPFA